MTTPLTLTPGRRPDGTALLTAVGEIDMSNTRELAAALAGTDGPLVLDLTGVEYLDSAGLSVLFPHADRIELIAGPLLEPVLTISGLTELTTVHGT
ncbi:STAS domain-containing protein [Streptomyces sp. NPDC060334]|uniref:STAS domain-containing protein n=1 Tax=unclassified Streptomyces TaxID=2593676 RepID=UPI0006ADCB39|nr:MULTISPECIES: STAS domain-containing protein [unclassified Streptomyces]KOU68353.1 anti-anti-sigma regulatory factor [Streptomyces sp. WM4235]MCX5075338.1 STAS domain-containing protein [Streptomyces sp. NBC_00424]MCX5153046.1 STAS domain-containing protein [Streptomyces sp. NBC_00291]WUD41540.1 STAS domain-containing protein [Streptomyces sp. NBC_00513]